jgi:cell division septum initiation protein DivIVA
MPLSASVMINRDEVLELLEEAIARLPEELRSARWLLKEREEFLAKVQREGDDILDAARARAERMVQRTEVVKAAEQRARSIVETAEAAARRMRHEAEDYCDQKLASFEIVLERTMKMVRAGREKLQATPLSPAELGEAVEAEADDIGAAFFDQDQY